MIKKIESILIFSIIFLLSITMVVKVFNIDTKVVQSDSMYPSVKKNDLVYINKNINIDKLSVGDTISFTVNGSEVLHRIVEIKDTSIITKGDNNQVLDAPVSKNNVTGKLVFTLPMGGYLLNLTLWIVLIGVYGVIYMTRLIIKEFKKE